MVRLTGAKGTRLFVLLTALALLLSTGCWAGAYMGSYANGVGENGSTLMDKTDGGSAWPSMSFRGTGSSVAPYDQEQGLRVRATGTASGIPDIAVISLGVESVEDTASEARAMAATAMAGVMEVLEEAGIEDRDIQTNHFNISPRYQSVRVTQCHDDEDTEEKILDDAENCTTFWDQQLVGYAVNNQASVNIRNLNEAGTIIDQVTDAAGDLVRVNGIRFTIEDIEALQDEARNEAMAELERKAEAMAELAGVALGRLVHLQEDSGYIPPQPVFARAAFASESAADTSISAGELDVSVSVNGIYLIAEPETE